MRLHRVLSVLLATLPLCLGHASAAGQAVPGNRAVHVSGVTQSGGYGVLVNITLQIAPGADTAAIVGDALARHGAQPITNCSQLPILYWPQFFDRSVKEAAVPQYHNPAGDTTPGGSLQSLLSGQADWSAVAKSTYALQYKGTTTQGNAFDGMNTVSWPTPWPYSPAALAITTTYFRVATGEIVEADIAINHDNFGYFANPVDLAPDRYDIRYVMLHENGHAAGLCHSPDPTAVMYAFTSPGVVGHGLAPDDMDQITWLYRRGPAPTPLVRIPQAIRVPEDYATIQLAVDNAQAGDRIQVGPGKWCGARITKTLHLTADGGATIIGCPAGNPGPVGSVFRRGFRIEAAATGTSITHFTFDGSGFSDANLAPLYRGIEAAVGANNLVIDDNTFHGGAYGIFLLGSSHVQITHNHFDGFVIRGNGDGGVAILDIGAAGPVKGHSIQYNEIQSVVPAGSYAFASWVNEADVPFAGIVLSGQDGAIVSNNKVAIAGNGNGDGGAGIIATDKLTDLSTRNLTLVDNDGRGSAYALVITNDAQGGSSNTAGATLRGNLGVNLIGGARSNIRNRSKLLLCDPDTGVCP